jgi:hypothetical protein
MVSTCNTHEEKINSYIVLVEKTEGKRSLERFRRR